MGGEDHQKCTWSQGLSTRIKTDTLCMYAHSRMVDMATRGSIDTFGGDRYSRMAQRRASEDATGGAAREDTEQTSVNHTHLRYFLTALTTATTACAYVCSSVGGVCAAGVRASSAWRQTRQSKIASSRSSMKFSRCTTKTHRITSTSTNS